VAGPLFPVGAAIGGLVGAAATGLYTRLRDTGVNDQFIKDVAKQLDKGKSALFVMYEGTISPAMVDALRVYDAELVYGELPEGAVEAVTEAYEAEAHEELVEELDIFNEAATEEDLEATEEDVEAMTALAAVTADVPEDNLEVIDGIGPKVSAALKAGGITTYKQLHEAGEPALRAALTGGGVVPPASMTTWSKQAEFAVNGDWKGLFQYNAKRKVKK
jgi:predicted flap endonuclease-1-like 5' DNA nuclease